MRCSDAHRLLSLRMDGELDSRRVADLDAHLSDCDACYVFARDLARCAALLDTVVIAVPRDGFAERLLAGLPAQGARGDTRPLLRGLLRPLPLAAAALAFCLGMTLAGLMGGSMADSLPTVEQSAPENYAESFDALPEKSAGARYITLVLEGGS